MLNIKTKIKLFVPMLFFIIMFINPKISQSAFGWGQNGVSQTVDSSGAGISSINPKSVQITPNKYATTYTVKNSTGTVLRTINHSEIVSTTTVMVPAKGSIHMTYMGSYEARNVDVILTNELTTYFDVTISPEGTIRSTNVNYGTSLGIYNANKIASIQLVYTGSTTPLSNVPIALTQRQDQSGSLGTIGGSHFYAYDMTFTNKFYGNPAAVLGSIQFFDANRKYTIELYGSFILELLISGSTDSMGRYNFYKVAYNQTRTEYTFISPMKSTIVPITYPLTNHTVKPTPVNNGTAFEINVSQFLPEQGIDNFYPVDGTFNLNITEDNISHLNVKASDFSLFVEGVQIPTNQYTLSVVPISASQASINLKLPTSFLKTYRGKKLDIKQVSTINKDETIIKNALQSEQFLPVTIGTKLTYSLPSTVQSTPMTINTEFKTTDVKVEPTIEHTVATNLTYVKGTALSSIPIKNIITSAKNVDYPWDTISMSYVDPTKVLTTTGVNTISVLLESDTFTASKVVNVNLNVIDSFNMTYDGNGGTIGGKTNQLVVFDLKGTTLPTPDARKNYKFKGWSTDKAAKIGQYSSGYVYGLKAEEQKNTTLYAIWELSYELTTSWNKSSSQKTQTINADRSDPEIKVPYYYKSTGSQISYLVNVKENGSSIYTKKITSTTADIQYEDVLTLPANLIKKYGNNPLKIEFYELNSSSAVINPSSPNNTLDLTVNITGSLKMVSVPATLDWTTLKSRDTKGIAPRDKSNQMTVEILDSRNLDESQKNWYVQAVASYPDQSFDAFELVWRDPKNNTTKTMKNNPIQVMTQTTAQKNNYSYLGVWDYQNGVLLNSSNYLKVGKYENKITVNWSLYDVMVPQ